jgi:hypothetical protein
MDNIWNIESLMLFLVFFIPGFISQKIYGLIVADDSRDSSTIMLNAIAYSSFTYALALPLIWQPGLEWWAQHTGWLAVATICFVLVMPVLLPVIWIRIRGLAFIKRHTLSPIKRPWDSVFDRRASYWVIVTFKNGDKMAGLYGPNSSASTFPTKEQIYLEKVWRLAPDGTFDREVENTKGAIILGDEIMTIELLRP